MRGAPGAGGERGRGVTGGVMKGAVVTRVDDRTVEGLAMYERSGCNAIPAGECGGKKREASTRLRRARA